MVAMVAMVGMVVVAMAVGDEAAKPRTEKTVCPFSISSCICSRRYPPKHVHVVS